MSNTNQTNNYSSSTMILTGTGYVNVQPDTAIIRLGVVTKGYNLPNLQTENAAISQAVLDALKQFDISELKTLEYILDKNYEMHNGERIEKGYLVRHTFEIKMNQMDQIGMLIDQAVNSGANYVESIVFDVSNIEIYYLQALNLAVMNAYKKARSISLHLGLQREPFPSRIVENSATPIPYSQMFRGKEQFISTPIEPGLKKIEATVTIDFI